MSLERIYRILLLSFPADWRARHGDDLVATLLHQSPDRRIPVPGDVIDVVARGVQCRAKRAGPVVQIMAAVAIMAVTTGFVHVTITPTSWAFLATSLVVVIVPGTGAVYSIATAMTAGWRRGSIAALGCTLGIVPHLLAATVGLSGVMQTSAQAFEVVRWLGVAYLAYLAVGMLRSTGRLGDLDAGDGSSASAWSTIRHAVLINVLNPKLTIFFFAFLPQFLDTPPGLADVRLLGLSAVFMAMTLAVFLVYAAAASALRSRVLGRHGLVRRIEQSLGVVLAGFAIRLATSER